LQKLYPYYVAQFFVCTSIFSHADEPINYVPYSHLDGSTDELPELCVYKLLKNAYRCIRNYLNVIAIVIIVLIFVLYVGILAATLSGVRIDTFKFFAIVGTLLFTGPIVCVVLVITFWNSMVNRLEERKIFYPAIKLLVPLPKFATYPAKYNFFYELLKPAPNEFNLENFYPNHKHRKFDPKNPIFDNDLNNPWNLVSNYDSVRNESVIEMPSFILHPNLNINLYEYFETSLLAVYKLMTGDTSSLSNWEYRNNIALVALWITFSFFTVIYLLNLFIGLLNIAIAGNNSRVLFLLLRAELIAEIEIFFLLPHQRRWKSWFPDRIFYYAHVNKLKNKIHNLNTTYEDSRYKPNIQNNLLELLHLDAKELNLTTQIDIQEIQKIDKSTQTDN
ncbi:21179_t:CDS:2, partial [Racocetra persica]